MNGYYFEQRINWWPIFSTREKAEVYLTEQKKKARCASIPIKQEYEIVEVEVN
jgi:hypothetical protein